MSSSSSTTSLPSAPPSSLSSDRGDVHSFVLKTTSLVALERRAEVDEEAAYKSSKNVKELEAAGVLLTRLVVTDVATGLYGRCLLTLEAARGGPLKQSELSARDIVELNVQGTGGATGGVGTKLTSGIVYRVKETSITIVLDEFLDPTERVGQMSVLKLANQVTYDRYKYALDTLSKEFTGNTQTNISSRLLRVLYDDVEPVSSTKPIPWTPFSASLNASQKIAIQQALDANDVAMIHGPPGTGKTTTVVELIRQFVSRGLKVLACAPSNLAVDNLVEKLSEKLPSTKRLQYDPTQNATGSYISASSSGAFEAAISAQAQPALNTRGFDVKLCRLGHPARIIPSVLKFTLDSVVKQSDAESVCAGIRADMSALTKALDKSKDRSERNTMRRDLRELQRALREHERKAIKESLKNTEVICCTLTNCASKLMDVFGGAEGKGFDVVVIDEAAQALEVACLLPILKGRKLILAGDNQQLGPTVKSHEAVAQGFERTLFDRLYAKPYGQRITTMLVEQYRMHGTIMKWSSDELYQGRLIGPDSITKHLLSDLDTIRSTEDTIAPFVVIDTAGLNMYEDVQPSSTTTVASSPKTALAASVAQQRSKSNANECALLKQHLEALLAAGLQPKDIGLITPYNGQVSLLREMLLDEYGARGLEIGTVDGFQGREKEAILISLVRSNDEQEVGFLKEDRRINVAITRARRHVCIVLDSSTVSSHPFLARLIDYASEHGDYRMATDPNEVHRDMSTVTTAMSAVTVSTEPSSSTASTPNEKKADDLVQHPIVSPSKPKKERVKPTPSPTPTAPSSSSKSSAAPVQPVTEEWSEDRIESICQDVLKRGRSADSKQLMTPVNYAFPSTLNSYQRQLVHSVAEKCGGSSLTHLSTGEGMKRAIVLTYVSAVPQSSAAAPSSTSPVPFTTKDDDDESEISPSPSSTLSKTAQKKAAKKAADLLAAQQAQLTAESRQDARRKALDAMELKTTGKLTSTTPTTKPSPTSTSTSSTAASSTTGPISSSSAAIAPSTSSAFAALDNEPDNANSGDAEGDNESNGTLSTVSSKPSKNKKKKKSKAEQKEAEPAEPAEDDFDSIMSEFSSDTCKTAGCSVRVKVFGYECAYCRERYCLKHMPPVLHGCGAAHKQHQLTQMKSELHHQQSGTKSLKDHERQALQVKLDKKIAEDKKARTKQTKKEEPKKK